MIGVGGPGMSAIAIALAEMGHTVSGSDIREQSVLERVRAAGVDVHVGHSRALVHGRDAITYSTAIPERNIERDEAIAIGVPSMHRSGDVGRDLRAGEVDRRRWHPREDLDRVDADADPCRSRLATEFRHRRRCHRHGHRRAVDGR